MISINSTQVVGLEQQGSDVQWAICSIECDTSNELPTYDQFKQSHNILLYQKSFAHVIDKNEIYEMNGQGSWIRQKSNSNIMLDAENVIYDNTDSGLSSEDVQGAIDELKSNDDMQDRALAELYAENVNQQLEIDYAINTGVKNLLPMTHKSGSITRYGVTCTWDVNSGTMTINGTHSSGDSSAIFEFYDGSAEATKILPAGSYVITGCPSGGSTSTYRAALSQIAGSVDVGNGATFELSEPHYAAYRILISGNVTFNNMVFKPMIRLASITDSTFQPYALPNPKLTPAAIKAVDEGAKNLLHFDQLGYSTVQGMSMVHRGVTFTLTDDTVVCSGTNDNTDNSHCRLYIGSDRVYVTDLCDGNHILSGTPSGGGAGKWSMSAYYGVSGVTKYNRSDYGEGVLLTEPSESGYNILIDISISKGQNASGLIFKPMICTAADWAASKKFVPYCPTNRELYEMILAIQSQLGMRSVQSINRSLDSNYDLLDTVQEEPDESEER